MYSQRPLIDLIQIAAQQKSLEGISQMLKSVTQSMRSWGTLIWAPSAATDIQNGQGRLFVLAYWVSDPHIRVWHEIGFQSMTGWVLQRETASQSRLGDSRNLKRTPRLIEESKTCRFALAPMLMADGTKAVLEVYRVQDEEFTLEEMQLLEEMGAVLPVLYANLTDRVGVKLLDDVNEKFLQADSKQITREQAKQQTVDAVAAAFSGLEVSLFLKTLNAEPDTFPLAAHKKVWEDPWTGRNEYALGQGATGYVLKTGTTVLLDLAHYAEEETSLQSTYPGLKWEDSLKIQDRARDYFQSNDPESSPPLNFVCAPVRSGETILGAIRCSGSTTSPFYFDRWQARYLEALGQRLGSWWNNILKQEQLNSEIHTWESLVSGFDKMNRFVQKQLNKKIWDEAAFFREAMRLAHAVIPHTDNSDVALADGNHLVTVATYGPDWDHSPGIKTAKYKIRPPESAASYLLAQPDKSVDVFDRVEDAPYVNRVLPTTRKLVLAKIEAGDDVYGVLRIRSKSPRPFSPNVRLIAGLLGQQLGLYHSLGQQIHNLQKAEGKNRTLIDTQAKTLRDVHHQVKTPIINAHRTAQMIIANRALPRNLRADAERVRGLCGKVARVVRNMGVFADLASDKPVRITKALLTRDLLLRALREACEDHQSMVDPDRNLRFELNEKSFEELAGRNRVGKLVEGDWALLEQCLNNLIDNAAKYSYPGTVVSVLGGIQARATEFFISFVNEGFEVKPDEVHLLKRRGYRSDRAIAVTGEGSGIGLWIVDEIMKAHGGRLAISPTQHALTDFRLVFPVVKGVDKLTYEPHSALARG